jgi:peptidoglycan hydrolase-like protein with peptidoglycan-binding domain
MNFRTARVRIAAGAVAALAAGAMAVSVSPASANASAGWVTGSNSPYDDWDDEGTLSSSSYAKSNATCLWQKILWAEGATEKNGTAYDAADIDGAFGSNTTYTTKKLQARWGLSADGKVGNKTFTAAGNKLKDAKYVDIDGNKKYQLTYDGKVANFTVYRGATNKWTFYDGDGKFRGTHYKVRHCS